MANWKSESSQKIYLTNQLSLDTRRAFPSGMSTSAVRSACLVSPMTTDGVIAEESSSVADPYKRVSREEFRAFLEKYPGTLEHDCTSIVDPPLHNYCDWSKVTAPIGTLDAHLQALQAYCVYADERGGEDKFWLRNEGG